eukprot:gene70-4319_t
MIFEKYSKSFQFSNREKFDSIKLSPSNYLTLYLSTISFEINDISTIENFHIGHFSSLQKNQTDSITSDLLSIPKEENSKTCQILTPNYLEGLHVFITLPSLLFCLSLFGVSLWFQNKEPINSRSFTPMTFLLLIYGMIISQVFFYTTTVEWREKYYCYIFPFFDLTFKTTCLFLILLQYLNFILKNFLYKKKYSIFSKIKQRKEMNIDFIKILNFLMSTYFIGLLTVIFILFFWFISIFYAFPFQYNGTCILYNYQMNQFLHFIVRTIIIIFIIGLQILDLFLNCDIIRFPYKYYVDNDPFYFRIQLLPFPIFAVYFFISEVILYFYPNEILQIIFHSISNYSLLTMQCIFPLIITIIKMIIFSCIFNKKNYKIDKLPIYLNKDGIKHHFENYCLTEWNLEYLYLWQSIKEFEKLKTEKEMRKLALEIQQTFLQQNGLFYVNINQPNREEINLVLLKNENLTFETFANISKAAETHLFYSFFRFSLTKEFKDLRIDETLKKQSLHLLDDFVV